MLYLQVSEKCLKSDPDKAEDNKKVFVCDPILAVSLESRCEIQSCWVAQKLIQDCEVIWLGLAKSLESSIPNLNPV